MAKLREPTDSFTIKYPKLIEFTDRQLQQQYWRWDEILVDKDKHQFYTELTEAERHAISVAAKLFVKYEVEIGDEYWNGVVAKMYPRHEVRRMAAAFAMTELCIHAPFYAEINRIIGLDKDEFWNSWKEDEAMTDRVKFLDEAASKSDLHSLAVFSMTEGSVLYSSFALFKSYGSNGHNLIPNFIAGINQSHLDEDLHHLAGAYLFKTDLKESRLAKEKKDELFSSVQQAAQKIFEHECLIIDKFFEKGELRGITKNQFITFLKMRLNYCLGNLGIDPIFVVEDSEDKSVYDWFGAKAKAYVANDFFNRLGSEYETRFKKEAFAWKVLEENV